MTNRVSLSREIEKPLNDAGIELQSHRHVSCPVRAVKDNVCEMDWDVSWQLRGLGGNCGIFVVVTGCIWQPSSKGQVHFV